MADSQSGGTAQLLSNDNILITASDSGRAFEVTPEERIVWEFYNPQKTGSDDEYIATFFELVRVDEAAIEDRALTPKP